MTDSLVYNYSKCINNNFYSLKKLTNIVNCDNSIIELNNSITIIIDEIIKLIDKVNNLKPGYYKEEEFLKLKDNRKKIMTNEEIIIVSILNKLKLNLKTIIEHRLNVKKLTKNIECRYSNIPGLSIFGNNEFLNLLILNDEVNLIENLECITTSLIIDTYNRLINHLNILKESCIINYEEKGNELKITFKLYKLHPYFNKCHNILISLKIDENDSLLLKKNLNKIKEKILTIALLLKNLKTF